MAVQGRLNFHFPCNAERHAYVVFNQLRQLHVDGRRSDGKMHSASYGIAQPISSLLVITRLGQL